MWPDRYDRYDRYGCGQVAQIDMIDMIGMGVGQTWATGTRGCGADVGVDPLHGRKMLARDRGVKFLRCC